MYHLQTLPFQMRQHAGRWLLGSLLLISHLCTASTTSDTDALVQKWLDLEHQSSALHSEWQRQKPILQQRLDLLKKEKQQLQGMLQNHQSQRSEVESKRAALLAEQNAMEQHQQTLNSQLVKLREQLNVIQHLLPPPLQQQWQAEQQVLENQRAETGEANTSTQLQVSLAQLSKLMEFDKRITVHEMNLTAPSGQDVRVKQLYLGLGSAWFVSGDGSYAGTGQASANGWQWAFQAGLDGSVIQQAIAIYEKHAEADFISLPLDLQASQSPSLSDLPSTQQEEGEN
ncbi:hypothetical protein TDB9533_00578 [Thalassocella blandensis]|nr:hypothetical protein TDB9533_00578 [Thalassocella blandensis]